MRFVKLPNSGFRSNKKRRYKKAIEDQEFVDASKRRVSIFAKGKTMQRFKPSVPEDTVANEEQAKHLAETSNFKKEIEGFLEGFGGNYRPDFGYETQLSFDGKNKWGSVLDYICGDSKNERVSTVIKTMKGK